MLLSGVMVKFDQLHLGNKTTREFTPFVGDMMTARWSFEAMAVEQFKNNKYERHIFESNMNASQNCYYGAFLINNGLKNDLQVCASYNDSADYQEITNECFARLNYHIAELSGVSNIEYGIWKDSLTITLFNAEVYKSARLFLDTLRNNFIGQYKHALSVTDTLLNVITKEEVISLREDYENKRLRVLALDIDNPEKLLKTPGKYLQKFQPGYKKGTSKFGRAQFYAPYKLIGNVEIDTFWFNILTIWFVGLLLYGALYFNLLQKIINWFENLRLPTSES